MRHARQSRHIAESQARDNPPVFPLEIFDNIIDHLGNEGTGWCNTTDAFLALKACTLVCLFFRRRALFYTFRRISIHFNSVHHKSLLKLVSVLQSNPELPLYVREFRTVISSLRRIPESVTETVLRFPSLTSLAIVLEEPSDDTGSETNFWGFGKTEAGFYRDILKKYLASDKLNSLELTHESHIPFTDILSCPHLHTLRLNKFCIEDIVLSEPTSTVKHLHIREGIIGTSLPVSFLSHFPSLTTLEIDEDFDAEHPSMIFSSEGDTFGHPSFNLERLYLNSGCSNDGIHQVLEFVLQHAQRKGVKAFKSLKELHVVATDIPDLDAIKAILDDIPALRSFKINGAVRPHSDLGINDFDLHDHLLPCCGALTDLSLTFPSFYHTTRNHQVMMDRIHSLVSSLSNTNILETLDLNVRLLSDIDFECPDVSAWGPIAHMLASQPAFPYLKSVRLNIQFVIDISRPGVDVDVLARKDAFECGDLVTFRERMGDVLQPLIARRYARFEWSASAHTSWDFAPGFLKRHV